MRRIAHPSLRWWPGVAFTNARRDRPVTCICRREGRDGCLRRPGRAAESEFLAARHGRTCAVNHRSPRHHSCGQPAQLHECVPTSVGSRLILPRSPCLARSHASALSRQLLQSPATLTPPALGSPAAPRIFRTQPGRYLCQVARSFSGVPRFLAGEGLSLLRWLRPDRRFGLTRQLEWRATPSAAKRPVLSSCVCPQRGWPYASKAPELTVTSMRATETKRDGLPISSCASCDRTQLPSKIFFLVAPVHAPLSI